MLPLLLLLCLLLAEEGRAQANYTLPFRPLDAEYSVALNRIVMISASPDQLQIYDPATRGNVAVSLPAAPIDLTLTPNGLYAAVAHEGSVSYVNLASGTLERSYPVAGRVEALVAGARYLYLDVTQNATAQLRPLDLVNGTVLAPVAGTYRLAGARLHPRGDAIYSSQFRPGANKVERLPLSQGLPVAASGNEQAQPATCGASWIAADGESLFNGCRFVFGLSAAAAADLSYRGSFPEVTEIQGLWEFGGRDELAVLAAGETAVRLYQKGTLRPTGRFALDSAVQSGISFPVRGRWVFGNSASELYVIVQAVATLGGAPDFSLRVFQLAATPLCLPSMDVTTVAAPAEGGVVKVNVTGGSGCLYRTESAVPWMRVTSEVLRYGSGEVRYLVRPNPGAARTGTINFGGRVLTVNQAAKPERAPNPLPLGYRLQGAAYSRYLGALLLLSDEPAELHILNVQTNEERVVPLRQPGLTVAIDSLSGSTAAVGHDGWISVVDLPTGAVTREYPVGTDARSLAWGENGFLYVFGEVSRQPALNLRLRDGRWTKAPAETASCAPGRKQPNAESLVLCGRRWSTATGELVAQAGGISAPFGLFWFNTTGDQLITNAGQLRRSTGNPADDFSFVGTLDQSAALRWAESSLWHRTLAAVGSDEVLLYGEGQLGVAGRTRLPTGVQGLFGFWSLFGNELYVLGRSAAGDQLTVISREANAPGCAPAFAGATAAVGPGESVNPAAVSAGIGCAWTAAGDGSPWLRLLSGGFGIGPANLSYSVTPNRSAVARSATVTLGGGGTLTVTQGAAPVAAEPTAATFTSAGGARSLAVTTAQAGTAWTATATVPWVTFPAGAAGAGNGTLNYTVAPNSGAARNGLIRVNAAEVSIQQEAGKSPGSLNAAPSVFSVRGNRSGVFEFVFRDPDGVDDLGVLNVLINRALDGRAACYIAYNAVTNGFYLVDDAGAGLRELLLNAPSASVENSQCSITSATVTITREPDRLILRMSPILKGAFGANLAVYAAVRDRSEANSGWQAGSVIRPAALQGPVGSLADPLPEMTVPAGSGWIVSARFSTTDLSGAGAITSMQVLVNSAVDAKDACYVGIDRAAMRAYLVTDDGLGLVPGGVQLFEEATPEVTENSRCILRGTGSGLTTRPDAPGDVFVTLRLEFKSSFKGRKFAYTGAQAAGAGRNSGWEVFRAVTLE
ncbi:MAG: BACON domain-containing protein [Acidobacteriaceae bacterium]|nr:BACON domain-containing protein [Acidobacteriaceae bacterium]